MNEWKQKTKVITQVGITFILLVTCLILIFGNFPDDNKKWAFGVIGVLVGYWLR